MSEILRKLVVVGNSGCGKTGLLLYLSTGSLPDYTPPTVFENSEVDVEVDGKHVDLRLWDASGLDDYDKLRPLSYPDSHVILICFAIDEPDSFDNVQEKWISEVEHFCKGVPIILVGCKMDLRSDPKIIEELKKTSQSPVTPEQGVEVAQQIGAMKYFECSAKTGEGVREVFQYATQVALLPRRKIIKKSKSSSSTSQTSLLDKLGGRLRNSLSFQKAPAAIGSSSLGLVTPYILPITGSQPAPKGDELRSEVDDPVAVATPTSNNDALEPPALASMPHPSPLGTSAPPVVVQRTSTRQTSESPGTSHVAENQVGRGPEPDDRIFLPGGGRRPQM